LSEDDVLGEEVHNRKHVKFVHEGKYVAEVEIEIIDNENGWAPYINLEIVNLQL